MCATGSLLASSTVVRRPFPSALPRQPRDQPGCCSGRASAGAPIARPGRMYGADGDLVGGRAEPAAIRSRRTRALDAIPNGCGQPDAGDPVTWATGEAAVGEVAGSRAAGCPVVVTVKTISISSASGCSSSSAAATRLVTPGAITGVHDHGTGVRGRVPAQGPQAARRFGRQVQQQATMGQDVALGGERRVRDGRHDQIDAVERGLERARDRPGRRTEQADDGSAPRPPVRTCQPAHRNASAASAPSAPRAPMTRTDGLLAVMAELLGRVVGGSVCVSSRSGQRMPKIFTNIGVSIRVCGAIAW